nr:MAG: hypothetical protein [Bacteriophage sp.]
MIAPLVENDKHKMRWLQKTLNVGMDIIPHIPALTA